MTTAALLTWVNWNIVLAMLNAVWGVLLTGIGIEMVNNPPDTATRKRMYRIIFGVLCAALIATTYLQSSKTESELAAERKEHDIEQGKLEGKLDDVSKQLENSSCPSKAEIGTVVQQELARRKYERVIRTPIAKGKLSTLSSDLLVRMVPSVTNYMRNFKDNWYGESFNIEQEKHEDFERQQWNEAKAREHETDRWLVSKSQPEWEADQKKINDSNRARFLQLLSDADSLRAALKNKLPPDALTSDDDAAVGLFAKASADVSASDSGMTCCPASIDQAAEYLDKLASRVSRVPTLQH
jgi:hypothetical protein